MAEKQVIQHKRHPLEEVVPLEAPYIVYIDPCGACNFKCNFCPCNTSDFMVKERHKVMDLALFHKIVDNLKEFPQKVRVVYLFAFGEPLLNKNIVEMIRCLRESQVCDEIRMYTNGALLNPELNSALADSGIDLIRISVNALDGNAYKELCGVTVDYSKFYQNLQDLYQKTRGKAKLAIKLVNATIKEQSQLKQFHEMYAPISDYIFMEDIFDGWPEFEDVVIPEGVLKSSNWDWRNAGHSICTYSLTTMTIHSNGWVSPCCADWKFGAVYGDVNHSTVKEIWNSKELRQMQLAHLKKTKGIYPICDTCTMRTVDSIDAAADIVIKRLESLDDRKQPGGSEQ